MGSTERHSVGEYDAELPLRVRRNRRTPPPDDPLPPDDPPPLRYDVAGGAE